MGPGGWAPSPNCQLPSPAGHLAEGGTQVLSSPPPSITPCCRTKKGTEQQEEPAKAC